MELGDFLTTLQQHIDPKMAIVIAALWVLGFFLKRTPAVKDWLIIWALTAAGIAGGILLLGPTTNAVLQGILAAGIAVYFHQLIKQTTDKRD